jgi:hypothetical protein
MKRRFGSPLLGSHSIIRDQMKRKVVGGALEEWFAATNPLASRVDSWRLLVAIYVGM